MTEITHGRATLLAGKDAVVRAIYDRLLEVLQTFGPFQEEPKKTSIHLITTSGFAGVHPRKGLLYLNVRMDRPLQGDRIAKSELRTYFAHCRQKCRATIDALTDEQAGRRLTFGWGDVAFAELLLYNMRHVQEHGAQLRMYLGQRLGSAPDWSAQAKGSYRPLC